MNQLGNPLAVLPEEAAIHPAESLLLKALRRWQSDKLIKQGTQFAFVSGATKFGVVRRVHPAGEPVIEKRTSGFDTGRHSIAVVLPQPLLHPPAAPIPHERIAQAAREIDKRVARQGLRDQSHSGLAQPS